MYKPNTVVQFFCNRSGSSSRAHLNLVRIFLSCCVNTPMPPSLVLSCVMMSRRGCPTDYQRLQSHYGEFLVFICTIVLGLAELIEENVDT